MLISERGRWIRAMRWEWGKWKFKKLIQILGALCHFSRWSIQIFGFDSLHSGSIENDGLFFNGKWQRKYFIKFFLLQKGQKFAAPTQSTSSQMHGRPTPNANSSNPNLGGLIEIGGYPKPDINQMLPFKPKLPPAASHPVPGGNFRKKIFYVYDLNILGVFPPPQIISQLLQTLPPPRAFNGPFVDVEQLMQTLANFNRERESILFSHSFLKLFKI